VRGLGDPARVRQIVRNLISNADGHGGPTIGVSVSAVGETARLTVWDDGPGVPPDEVETIFDPYHRVDPDGSVPGGVGLGLSISRQLARLMGGDLRHRRRSGRTVFELTLPIATSGEPTPPA